MGFEALPTELLVKIFNYLSIETLNLIEETCVRWSQIIIQNFYLKHILKQPYAIRRNFSSHNWSPDSLQAQTIKQLFTKVTSELPNNWREGRFTLSASKRVAEYGAGQDGQVTSLAVYQDKVYLGKSGSWVEVRDLRDLSLIRVLNTDLAPQDNETRRPCRLCQHGRTLAVLGPNRSRVRVFNTDTDEMVGEIETALGRVYNLAISDKLLILLSGWTLFYWSIDSDRPDRVRGQFRGSIPDFEVDDQFQNWLEAHEVVVNRTWLVTRATRMRILAEGGMRMTHFLHVRQVYPSGNIGPVIRPDSSRLPDTVYETTCMAISEGDMLAVGWRVMDEGVMTIMDLNTGERIHNIQTQHYLSSIQIPLKWDGNKLFLKIIPVSRPIEPDTDEFGVSLGYLDISSKELTVVPGLVFESSEDLLYLNETMVLRVHTKLERLLSNSAESHVDLNMSLETFALLESEEDDYNPVYSATLNVYDFWNTPEP